MTDPVEQKLCRASEDGCVEEVLSLLSDNPGLDVNWAEPETYWTSLHLASFYGHVEVVKLLLAHPHINVNVLTSFKCSPFLLCCDNGHTSVVQMLLKDPRVDITLEDDDNCTSLWWAAYYGHHEVIEWLIANGRDLANLVNVKGNYFIDIEYTALEIAREGNQTEAAAVLERFMSNPGQTRHELRVKLGVLDAMAAEVFALTVFLCDDLLQLQPTDSCAARIKFFVIASMLPMELQMILCHRVVGSMKQTILRKDSEPAFKSLARILLLLSSS